jgi:hypothetical protein
VSRVLVDVYEQGVWESPGSWRPRSAGHVWLEYPPVQGLVLTLGEVGRRTYWQVAGVQVEPPDMDMGGGLYTSRYAVVAFQRPGGIFGTPPPAAADTEPPAAEVQP